MSQYLSQPDFAILGAGFAGLAAAHLAREKGANPVVIAPNFGATQHFSGAFDLIDPRWQDPAGNAWQQCRLAAALEAWIRAHPEHVYARLSRGRTDFAPRLIGRMRAFLDFYGIPFVGDGEGFVCAFGSSGRFKPCAFAMSTQGVPVAELTRHSDVVYVAPPLLSDYPADGIVGELSRVFARVRRVDLSGWPVHRQAPLAALTHGADQADGLVRLRDAIKPHLGGASLVILPPILGRQRFIENHRQLEADWGVRVVELLSALPSVSGLRFTDRIRAALRDKDLTWIAGEAQKAEMQGRRVSALTVRVGEQIRTITPATVILATGKFLGGGIRHEGKFIEPLLNLPLFASGQRLNAGTHVTQLLNARALESQAFLEVGLRTDQLGRVVYQDDPVFENLKACGHVLSDFDFARDRCGFGVSVASALSVF